MIKYEGGQYVLYTHDGAKVLGRFDSQKEAKDREREINYFKQQGEKAGRKMSGIKI